MKLASGVYNASLTLDRTVALHGLGATIVATDGPGILVINAAVARVYDLAVVNNGGGPTAESHLGVLCQSTDSLNTPRLFLERTVVEASTQPMHLNLCRLVASRTTLKAPRSNNARYLLLVANMGTASFDRSTFIGGGSLAVLEAQMTITNSVLDGLTGDPAEGVLVAFLGSISVSYSTIFNSPLVCAQGSSPACASAAREGVCIENSIVNKPSSLSDSLPGDKCRCDYCIVSPQQGAVVGSNNLIGEDPSFKDPATSDFHLKMGSPAINAAHPSIPGTADYDGVARPQDGRSDLGAFEFKP